MITKNVEKRAELEKSKLLKKPEYSRLAETIKNRGLKTSMEQSKMFNNRGLSR